MSLKTHTAGQALEGALDGEVVTNLEVVSTLLEAGAGYRSGAWNLVLSTNLYSRENEARTVSTTWHYLKKLEKHYRLDLKLLHVPLEFHAHYMNGVVSVATGKRAQEG